MIKSLINKWFYPFDQIFEIWIISEDLTYCDKFQEMLQVFFNGNNLQTIGICGKYDEDQKIFTILIIDKIIKFKLKKQSLSMSDELVEFKSIEGDILFFITSFDKYTNNYFYNVATETDKLLCNIPHIRKVILVYLGLETHTNAVRCESEWHNIITPVYHLLNNYKKGELSGFTEYGSRQIVSIAKNLRYYSNKNPFFHGIVSANFLFSDQDTKSIVYGQYELICNLVMYLMSYEKINNYQYLEKEYI